MLICHLAFRFYSWLEATETNLIRSSLSLLIQVSDSRPPSLPVFYFTEGSVHFLSCPHLSPITIPEIFTLYSHPVSWSSLYFLALHRNLAVLWGHCRSKSPCCFFFPRSSYRWTWRWVGVLLTVSCSLSGHLLFLLPFLNLRSSVYTIKYHCDLSTIGIILSWCDHWLVVTLLLLS